MDLVNKKANGTLPLAFVIIMRFGYSVTSGFSVNGVMPKAGYTSVG